MIIFGAGLAGLLAANMLRRYKPIVVEAQPSLPNNHNAVLRFRSDAVSRATGIPFRKVTVRKVIIHNDYLMTTPNLRMANMYSRKVTGEVSDRSILNLDTAERYIAPPDLINQLAEGLDIRYNSPVKEDLSLGKEAISTIPMPILMKLVAWADAPEFKYRTVTSLSCRIQEPVVDVFQTIYYPAEGQALYRASITGDLFSAECIQDVEKDLDQPKEVCEFILENFGIRKAQLSDVVLKVQRFGKIAPIPNDVRKQFILAMSDLHGVYSLGRYATWRNILLDDVVNDVKVIEQFINQRNSYNSRLVAVTQ